MAELAWDQVGERLYETGVDHGVLYIPTAGVYSVGYAWNGLTGVTESPSGAEATPLYADNIKYLNLTSLEEFGGTIEAFTYPDEFGQCDGTAEPEQGVLVGQQARRVFGLSYRTRLGNDEELDNYAYKLHLVYGALAAPSEKAYATINDSPEAITFSWTFTTTPVEIGGSELKPTATLTINSSRVDPDALEELEDALYGTVATDPYLPLPEEVIALFSGSITVATPTEPTFVITTGVVTVPTVTGVQYRWADNNVLLTAGAQTAIADNASRSIRAYALPGYTLNDEVDNDWSFTANYP